MTRYATKSAAELDYIIKDATEAARCARDMGNIENECKYLDQVNDAATEKHHRRSTHGTGSHLYCIGVMTHGGRVEIDFRGKTRTQATALARKMGYEPMDCNMIG